MDPFQRDRLADGNRHANRGNQKIRHGQINHEVISHAENNKGDSFESFESFRSNFFTQGARVIIDASKKFFLYNRREG